MITNQSAGRGRRILVSAWLVLLAAPVATGQERLHSIVGFLGGPFPSVNFGLIWNAANAGDVDGDGVVDFMVGAGISYPLPATAPLQVLGGLQLYSGKTGRLLGPTAYAPGYSQGTWGRTIAGFSDFDGDGSADVLVGDPYDNGFLPLDGYVHVYDAATMDLKFSIPTPYPFFVAGGGATPIGFGRRIKNMGDIDGDGLDDVGTMCGLSGCTGLSIYSGRSGGTLIREQQIYCNSVVPSCVPLVMNLKYGDFAGIGDINGDGKAEYAASRPPGPFLAPIGGVSIFDGATGERIQGFPPPEVAPPGSSQPHPAWGRAITRISDIDGDGHSEIVVSDPGGFGLENFEYCNGLTWTGKERFDILSPATGNRLMHIIPARVGTFMEIGACPGQRLESGGDVNGDGFVDFIESRGSGRFVFVYSGVTGTCLFKANVYASVGAVHGRIVGDLDEDGYDDWSLGDIQDPTNSIGTLGAGAIHFYRGSAGDAYSICSGGLNSAGGPATLRLDGPISVSANDLHLLIESGPPGALAVAVFGPEVTNLPYGAGTLCVGGGATGLRRIGSPFVLGPAGVGFVQVDMLAGDLGTGPTAWTPGSTRVVQVLFRDGTTTNTTNALEILLSL